MASPFPRVPGERLYLTGDLVRRDREGALHFLGRRDAQIKVRGRRIEAGDVEHALLEIAGVTEAAVVAHSDADAKRLVAYVVGPAPGDRELRAVLAELLPKWMIPDVVIRLDALPRGRTGKLDRRALPAPDSGARTDANGHATDGSGGCAELLAAVQEVLGGAASATMTFVAQGGDSLAAMRIARRLRAEAGLHLEARDLLADVAIAHIVVTAATTGNDIAAASTAARGSPTAPCTWVATPTQYGMWFAQQLVPGSVA